MLVLCFNLLSFGGRELSSKYLQPSGRARVFRGRLELSVVRVPSKRARCCKQLCLSHAGLFPPLLPSSEMTQLEAVLVNQERHTLRLLYP